jgi:hypothetical protein
MTSSLPPFKQEHHDDSSDDKANASSEGPVKPAHTLNNTEAELQLKSARTLTSVATIAGPVSLFIGGVLLSFVGLVCAILALHKTKRIIVGASVEYANTAKGIRQSAIIGLVIAGIALVINAVTVAIMLPAIIEAAQSGSLDSLLGQATSATSTSSGGTSSGSGAWG